MSAMPAPQRTRIAGFGLLVVTFLVGALSGAAVDRLLSADEPDAGTRTERREGERRSYVIDRIEMAPEQRAAIDAILARRSERMRAVWQEAEPRLDAITDSARAEIMGVLTPEQREQYERKLEERRNRRQDRRRDETADSARGSGS